MKAIIAQLLDVDGYVLRSAVCDTQKEAISKSRFYLSNDDSLKAHKAEVLVNGDCIWDAFAHITLRRNQ